MLRRGIDFLKIQNELLEMGENSAWDEIKSGLHIAEKRVSRLKTKQ